MNKRTKILALVFGAFIAYGLVDRVVYPAWIEPLLTIDKRIAKRQKSLDRLEAEAAKVEEARYEYRAWVQRVGAFDQGDVQTEVRDRLNKLIDKHKLEEAKVSPSRAVEDRKTGLTTATLTVSAVGTLESSVGFMRDVAELPQLSRILNVSIQPSGSSRRNVKKNRVNLRVPVELWVLPQQKIVGRLEETELVHPEFFVRHSDRDFQRIWSGEPFLDFASLKAQATPTVSVEKGKPAKLDVRASGGSGAYTYKWLPAKGLSDAAAQSPTVDTSVPGANRYTVTVSDARGHTAQATVSVTIREPPPKVAKKTVDPEPPPQVQQTPKGPTRWPDGQHTDLRMALLSSSGSRRLDEFMLFNSRSKEESYYKVGDEFDDGELVFVHQTGGLVRTKGEYFVYPLGATLNQRLAVDSADEYPELTDAARRHREAVQGASQQEPAAKPVAETDEGASAETVVETAADEPRPAAEGVPKVSADSEGADATKESAAKPALKNATSKDQEKKPAKKRRPKRPRRTMQK